MTTGLRLRPGLWRIIRLEGRASARPDEVPRTEVQDRVAEVLGPGPVEVVWADRFRVHRRSSPRFRAGRVLLAGDAAHVHSPLGGLGMNAGIQDAHNLAWKLATALAGGDVDRLLDSYDVERRAVVVEGVSRSTDLATRVFLQTPSWVRESALALTRSTLRLAPVRRRALRAMSMLDLDLPGSPLLDPSERAAGVRLPDVLLDDPDGREVRLHALLPPAAPSLIALSSVAVDRGATHHAHEHVQTIVRVGPGGYRDPGGRLREVLGSRDGWLLIRPDRHLAWARPGRGHPPDDDLAWSLGKAAGTSRSTGREQGPLRATVRRVRDRTSLDMPHYR